MPLLTKPTPKSQGGGGGGGPFTNGPLTTRRGTVAAAGVVALLAGLVLLFALDQYRDSVADDGEAAKVLVANGLIPKGSSGDVLQDEELVTVSEVRADQLLEGAIVDPAALRGLVATRDIRPDQQLTAADFGPGTGRVQTRLTGADRAMAVTLDGQRSVAGNVRTGDWVDVLVAFSTAQQGSAVNRPVVKTLMQNVLVLQGGASEEGEEAASGGDVVLRVAASYVPELTYATENGRVWLTLRPGAGARDPEKEIVDVETVLLGERPLDLREGKESDDE